MVVGGGVGIANVLLNPCHTSSTFSDGTSPRNKDTCTSMMSMLKSVSIDRE